MDDSRLICIGTDGEGILDQIQSFVETCRPVEQEHLFLLSDSRTDARYIECHVRASVLVKHATPDVPLDPDDQPGYRANRDLVEDHAAFERMRSDAIDGRAFSNLVTEFGELADSACPLKIIGGQHRFKAIQAAFEDGVDELHGVKVYFGLDPDQRLDVQLISNTNIAVSTDLLDRMYETVSGPELRNWCQQVGLLYEEQDFADKRKRGQPITVRAARTFIFNYFAGIDASSTSFEDTRTVPTIAKTGVDDADWRVLKLERPELWQDAGLRAAGEEFAKLSEAQKEHFRERSAGKRVNGDFAEKALNYAVLSAWSYVAGLLVENKTRLERHYSLRQPAKRDPLDAAGLAGGRHKTDNENYRGLGYRTDAKERGRFVELFMLQAEKGDGINRTMIDLAIKKYHAKQAMIEVREAEERS